MLLASVALAGCGGERSESAADRTARRSETGSPTESDFTSVPPGSVQSPVDDAVSGTGAAVPMAAEVAREERVTVDASMATRRVPLDREVATGDRRRGPTAAMRSERVETFNALPADQTPMAAAPMAIEEPSASSAQSESLERTDAIDGGPLASLPAGSVRNDESEYATVRVFYATDRQRDSLSLADYDLVGNRDAVVLLGSFALLFTTFALMCLVRSRAQSGLIWGALGGASALGVVAVLASGRAVIEKRGVTYNAQRGELVRGVCDVTVPYAHRRGVVERPSVLRLEFREDQREHIVMTSAVELSVDDFRDQLASTVSGAPEQDVLVFVHGYNVDFQSAVRRTAQLAVDLPFQGAAVCYSWPSQGTLLGYTVDETNAAWTQTHLKQFLRELVQKSGARRINVIAHSMGNRPTTQALVELGREAAAGQPVPFDHVVLAAPDIDADRFRRDLAPELVTVADHVTLYASSSDQALIASKQVHGHPRAGESGEHIVVTPGIETVDVSGIDLSLLGHSYYGDSASILQDLYELVRAGLAAPQRRLLTERPYGQLSYWQLVSQQRLSSEPAGGSTR
ncbi:alpha/beta hydrolase [Roseiconus nitratireducens]|uniref:alpha/beta hydrolase n=1 Tax=Roseiconus nitratireducens TaxID=2605748 RepID=UPI001375B321|nr:alpha/beta hydrolase [Roseiconus nitratireducens]